MITKYMKENEANKAAMGLARDKGYAYIGQVHTDPSSPWIVGDTRDEVELRCRNWHGTVSRVMIDDFQNRQFSRPKPYTVLDDNNS